MDIIIEVLLDIITEGAIEGTKSKTIPKTIRCALFGFIFMIFLCVIGIFLYLSLKLRYNVWLSILFLGIAVAIAGFLTKLSKEVILKLQGANKKDNQS